jgi:5-methylcytosine-specific restriction endonuclease McrA
MSKAMTAAELYRSTEGYRASQKRYRSSPAGRVTAKRAAARWKATARARALKSQARATARGRDQRRMDEARRRAAIRGAVINDLTPADWAEVLAEFAGCCAYCGESGRLAQDHVWPLSRGGAHTRRNVVPACGSCNSKKGSSLLAEWFGMVPR